MNNSLEIKLNEIRYRTIIFDLDGTLLNTLGDLSSSVNYALRQYGMPERDQADVRRFLGNGARRLVELSVPEGTTTAKTEEVLLTFRKHYLAHSLEETAPYDGIPELLLHLHHMGVTTAIVSNKPDPAVKELHQHFFSDTVSIAIGETPSIRRKPAPDMVAECIRLLNCDPHFCLYVGDSEVDLLTSRNASLPCCSVSWGFRDRDFLIDAGATTIIDHPKELIELI